MLQIMCCSRFSVGGDVSEGYKGNRKYDILSEVKSNEDVERGDHPVASTPVPPNNPREFGRQFDH